MQAPVHRSLRRTMPSSMQNLQPRRTSRDPDLQEWNLFRSQFCIFTRLRALHWSGGDGSPHEHGIGRNRNEEMSSLWRSHLVFGAIREHHSTDLPRYCHSEADGPRGPKAMPRWIPKVFSRFQTAEWVRLLWAFPFVSLVNCLSSYINCSSIGIFAKNAFIGRIHRQSNLQLSGMSFWSVWYFCSLFHNILLGVYTVRINP